MNHPTISEQQQPKANSPPVTDDPTIAENLRSWYQKISGEGVSVFSDGEHPLMKIPEHRAREFIAKFGPLHPGDYAAEHKRDWRDDFRALA